MLAWKRSDAEDQSTPIPARALKAQDGQRQRRRPISSFRFLAATGNEFTESTRLFVRQLAKIPRAGGVAEIATARDYSQDRLPVEHRRRIFFRDSDFLSILRTRAGIENDSIIGKRIQKSGAHSFFNGLIRESFLRVASDSAVPPPSGTAANTCEQTRNTASP